MTDGETEEGIELPDPKGDPRAIELPDPAGPDTDERPARSLASTLGFKQGADEKEPEQKD